MRIGCERTIVRGAVRAAELERRYELDLVQGRRASRIDGKIVRKITSYFGNFNVVLFAPEDLAVVRGSPSGRRRFLDRAVFTWRSEHLATSQEYEKILRSRNRVLRDHPRQAAQLLDVYDEQLARTGAQLVCARTRFLSELGPSVSSAFERITQSGLSLHLSYAPGEGLAQAEVDLADPQSTYAALLRLMSENRRRDLARGSTSVGPHRDDLAIALDGQPAKSYASQGQTRAIVLAWKTALLSLLTERRQEAPILLLDDVSSELDAARNAFLFDFIAELEAQCFITTTHPKHVLLSAHRTDFSVSAGRIEKTAP